MLSDEWLSRYGLLENFNASVTGTGTGTWMTGVTAIALCTSCSRANEEFEIHNGWFQFRGKSEISNSEPISATKNVKVPSSPY